MSCLLRSQCATARQHAQHRQQQRTRCESPILASTASDVTLERGLLAVGPPAALPLPLALEYDAAAKGDCGTAALDVDRRLRTAHVIEKSLAVSYCSSTS
jgi:hypothetical protein